MTPASKPQKKVAAFFDVDNTLVCGSTSILFGKVAFTGGSIKRRDIWRFMWEHVMYMRRGEKNSKMADFKDRALMLTKGHSVEELQGLIDQVYRDEIKPRLWPRSLERLKHHLEQGHEVWLVSAAPVELAQAIADDLGATGALGTIVGHDGNVLTGELVGAPLHGKAKRRAIKALAKERGISLRKSWAYSDSVNDLPMLSAVGNQVAVNPDQQLRRYAVAAGWEILRQRRRELRAQK
ncbi:HAD-IB family hydrolase [Aquiluna sp.]|uniref:HAD family hydrolase n=1 Tax=Aquiluna sp. TaxID=2053504 RepID=UPI00230A94F4|nr:HAD-IB family hydrolase [Aquiluna sp.]